MYFTPITLMKGDDMSLHSFGTAGAQIQWLDDQLSVVEGSQTIPLGGASELPTLITQLQQLSTEQEVAQRYTPEGIDRFFRANPTFSPSLELWAADSIQDWRHLSGQELFNRYQSHAETYVWGCRDFNEDPTYEGFREWLCLARDCGGDVD